MPTWSKNNSLIQKAASDLNSRRTWEIEPRIILSSSGHNYLFRTSRTTLACGWKRVLNIDYQLLPPKRWFAENSKTCTWNRYIVKHKYMKGLWEPGRGWYALGNVLFPPFNSFHLGIVVVVVVVVAGCCHHHHHRLRAHSPPLVSTVLYHYQKQASAGKKQTASAR